MTADSDRWARDLRHLLSIIAEDIESNPKIANQRAALARLVRDLTEAVRTLPLADQPMDEIALEPLKLLAVALHDLSNGVEHPLFTIKSGPGRRPSSAQQARERAHAIAFVELLIESNLPSAEAEAAVAKAFCRAGLRGRNQTAPTRNTIKKWRDAASRYGERPREGDLAAEYLKVWKRAGCCADQHQIRQTMSRAFADLKKVGKPLI